MTQPRYPTVIATSLFIALANATFLSTPGQATNLVGVTCEQKASVPTVIATLSNQKVSQAKSILSFLPQYFSSTEGINLCQKTAEKLNTVYSQNRMNYLASDTIEGQPVVCAVERRGLSCDSYNSEVLFSVNQSVNPTELLYNMLGGDFKGSKVPSTRTVSRIYTDLRPLWWPFN